MHLTFPDLHDFNQLKLGLLSNSASILCLIPLCSSPFMNMHVQLPWNFPNLAVCTLLWERSPVFSILAASNKSFLLLIFGFLVFFCIDIQEVNPVFHVAKWLSTFFLANFTKLFHYHYSVSLIYFLSSGLGKKFCFAWQTHMLSLRANLSYSGFILISRKLGAKSNSRL